jgi:hypothetical protein
MAAASGPGIRHITTTCTASHMRGRQRPKTASCQPARGRRRLPPLLLLPLPCLPRRTGATKGCVERLAALGGGYGPDQIPERAFMICAPGTLALDHRRRCPWRVPCGLSAHRQLCARPAGNLWGGESRRGGGRLSRAGCPLYVRQWWGAGGVAGMVYYSSSNSCVPFASTHDGAFLCAGLQAADACHCLAVAWRMAAPAGQAPARPDQPNCSPHQPKSSYAANPASLLRVHATWQGAAPGRPLAHGISAPRCTCMREHAGINGCWNQRLLVSKFHG